MDINREELSRIKEVLKSNPRGMNVIEIAKAINMHRQSVAKYMEMLVISGHVDVKTFGPSKVYYLSQRLPISAMLSLSSEYILIVDRDLMIVNVNDRFLELTKARREDILYKKMSILSFPLEFEPSITPIVIDAINGKESASEAYYKKNGNERFFNIKFIPLVFDDGQQGATVLLEDITDRKLIEMAIRESEQKLRSVIEQSLDGIIITDEHGVIIEYNKGEETILGVGSEDAFGKYVWDIVYSLMPDERKGREQYKKVKSIVAQLLKAEKTAYANKYFEIEIQRPDKTRRTIQAITTPIQTEKGFMICGISRDVTDRKHMEEALRESDENLRVISEAVAEGVAIYRDEDIIDVNMAVERITGYSKDELLRMKFWEIVHPDFRAMVIERCLRRQHDETVPSQHDVKLITKSGEPRWVEFNTGLVVYKGKPSGVITIFDVTGRKQAGIEQEQLLGKLKEANDQISAITYMAGIAAAATDLEEFLGSTLARLVQVIKADAGVILIKENDRVNVKASIGRGENAISQLSIPVGRGFQGMITASGEPLYIEDVQTDTRAANPTMKDNGFHSVLGVPIKHHRDIIGVLHVEWMSVHPYDKQEEAVLQVIADRCGAAIAYATLYENFKKIKIQAKYRPDKHF